MTPEQIAAFLAAAGAEAGKVKLLAASFLVAVAFLWVASVVRNLGMAMLHGQMRQKTFVIYTVRALVLVMVVIMLIS